MAGVEPASSAWHTDVVTTEPHPDTEPAGFEPARAQAPWRTSNPAPYRSAMVPGDPCGSRTRRLLVDSQMCKPLHLRARWERRDSNPQSAFAPRFYGPVRLP